MKQQAKYMHCSLRGSYRIDCEIIDSRAGEYYIIYYDSTLGHDVAKWVYEDYLEIGDE